MYGTAWKEDRTKGLVLQALETGFRAIDTANQRKHYHEVGVGEALTSVFDAGQVGRKELFLQTKFTFLAGQDHRLPYDPQAPIAEQVHQSFHSSMDHLGTDFLDSFVLHGPSSGLGLQAADREAWKAMEELHIEGLTRHLGLSNVNPDQLEQFVNVASIKPTFVQNRCFAMRAWDLPIRRICQEHDIVYQGFSLLTANPFVLTHPQMAHIADREGVTTAQLVFAFARELGMLPLTGTTDPDHMHQDLLAMEGVELTASEVAAIERMAVG